MPNTVCSSKMSYPVLHVPTNKVVAIILEAWHTENNKSQAGLLARVGKVATASLAKHITAGFGSKDEHHSCCTARIGYKSSGRVYELSRDSTVAGRITRSMLRVEGSA